MDRPLEETRLSVLLSPSYLGVFGALPDLALPTRSACFNSKVIFESGFSSLLITVSVKSASEIGSRSMEDADMFSNSDPVEIIKASELLAIA